MFRKKVPVEKGLKIIIVGGGKVGATLIQQLIKEGHTITIIDKNPATIQELTNHDKAKDFYVDCKYTHELMKDPNRDEALRVHYEMLEKKRQAKLAAKAAQN